MDFQAEKKGNGRKKEGETKSETSTTRPYLQ